MFKKAVDARAQQRLSGADRKKLRRTIKDKLPSASDEELDLILPPKVILVQKVESKLNSQMPAEASSIIEFSSGCGAIYDGRVLCRLTYKSLSSQTVHYCTQLRENSRYSSIVMEEDKKYAPPVRKIMHLVICSGMAAVFPQNALSHELESPAALENLLKIAISFFAVYALWKVPHLYPSFLLKGWEVSKYVVSGADLMLPGVQVSQRTMSCRQTQKYR